MNAKWTPQSNFAPLKSIHISSFSTSDSIYQEKSGFATQGYDLGSSDLTHQYVNDHGKCASLQLDTYRIQ